MTQPQGLSAAALFALSCVSALSACATAPQASPSAKETAVMTNAATTGGTGHTTAPVSPKLTAEQALTRLLELIRTTRTIQDFTPEKLTEVMGVKMEYAKDGSGSYGFGEAVTRKWNYGLGVNVKVTPGPRFDFSFDPIVPGTYPDMTDICQLDADRFGAALEAMGFSKAPNYGEHGRHLGHIFDRPGMRVSVEVQSEANDPPEKIAHDCVQLVTIWS